MNNQKHIRKWRSYGYLRDPNKRIKLHLEDAISERILSILEIILKNGSTYQKELADEFNVSFTTLTYPLGKLYRQGLIRRVPGTDKNGRLIQKIGLGIEEEELKSIIKIFKKARKDIGKGISLLDEGTGKYFDELKEPGEGFSFEKYRKK